MSAPSRVARCQQSLLGQPLPERPLLDRNARALIARQLLRRGEGGLRLKQEVVVADPAEPLTVRPPDLPLVWSRADGWSCQPQRGGVLGLGPGIRIGEVSTAAADRRAKQSQEAPRGLLAGLVRALHLC